MENRMEIVKWDRYFALYDQGELVCVTVYKKGAQEVKRRIEELKAWSKWQSNPSKRMSQSWFKSNQGKAKLKFLTAKGDLPNMGVALFFFQKSPGGERKN